MATVRIYKVAELLNTSSQDVLALLKRAHGIETLAGNDLIPGGLVLHADYVDFPPATMHHIDNVAVRR